jgi:4-hydroxythreonine-4-phosphate dehydrogenase
MALSIGLTLGDPCGIGPELWLRLLCQRRSEVPSDVELVLYGDAGVLERAAQAMDLVDTWRACQKTLRLVEVTTLRAEESRPGQPGSAAGAAQVAYLEAAIGAAQAGALIGLCTAPIHKASAHDAGLAFPGHTELLAARLGNADRPAVMMLCGPSLRVALATTHVRLAEVPQRLSVEGLADVIRTTALALRDDFGLGSQRGPRLFIAGLNPHAGEMGHFGDEESRLIAPAMRAAAERLRELPRLELLGPLVPDALFRVAVHAPVAERPDAVVAMYHDQGLIPLKLLDFDQAVNVTLGLRVVRTSPDHGVAHDIAADYKARHYSQAAALSLCIEMARRRLAKAD